MRKCLLQNLGHLGYEEAFELQRELVSQRRQGLIPDHLLIVEHPHVITMGRNGRLENVLASDEILSRAGVSFHYTDRGGDVTYHGPGQVVGYPIIDLREWKRDVVAYVRGLEQVIMEALADFGIASDRATGMTGVWVNGRKIAAIGVHISRWVTSHGFALNLNTDLSYFGYIVPCGLTKPVTSIESEGARCSRDDVVAALARRFGEVFGCEMESAPSALLQEKV